MMKIAVGCSLASDFLQDKSDLIHSQKTASKMSFYNFSTDGNQSAQTVLSVVTIKCFSIHLTIGLFVRFKRGHIVQQPECGLHDEVPMSKNTCGQPSMK